MNLTTIIILAVVQGLAELLPVSSSAHVIAAAKLMGEDPASPPFTLLLVMLHTGTMFAVIVYFWRAWMRTFFSSKQEFARFATKIIIATGITGVIGFGIKIAIEKYLAHKYGSGKDEIEQLFGHLELLAAAMAAAGILILWSGLASRGTKQPRKGITTGDSIAIGTMQAFCLPFRGFSRSGATISVGLLRGVARMRLEEFSFALAVVITPPLVVYESLRLKKHLAHSSVAMSYHDLLPSLLGMVFSFLAGLVALKLLSKLLEKGQWWVFGLYCLAAAGGLFWLHLHPEMIGVWKPRGI